MEVVKMTTAHAAMKKDLDLVEQKLHSYVKVIKFEELIDVVKTLTPLTDLEKTNQELQATIKSLNRFAIARDVYERFADINKSVFAELSLKMFKADYERLQKEYADEVIEEIKQI